MRRSRQERAQLRSCDFCSILNTTQRNADRIEDVSRLDESSFALKAEATRVGLCGVPARSVTERRHAYSTSFTVIAVSGRLCGD
jgi:hypothetical protein